MKLSLRFDEFMPADIRPLPPKKGDAVDKRLKKIFQSVYGTARPANDRAHALNHLKRLEAYDQGYQAQISAIEKLLEQPGRTPKMQSTVNTIKRNLMVLLLTESTEAFWLAEAEKNGTLSSEEQNRFVNLHFCDWRKENPLLHQQTDLLAKYIEILGLLGMQQQELRLLGIEIARLRNLVIHRVFNAASKAYAC